MTEQWRDVPGFEGAYQVSDLGRVRSLDRAAHYFLKRQNASATRLSRGRILRPFLKPAGYYRVDLFRDGKRIAAHIHTLVMLAFVGPRPEGTEIRHLNGVPGDSRLANLEYATHSRNLLDIKWHGGAAHHRLTPGDVLSILKRRFDPKGRVALAQEYGVCPTTIWNVWRGRTHKDIYGGA